MNCPRIEQSRTAVGVAPAGLAIRKADRRPVDTDTASCGTCCGRAQDRQMRRGVVGRVVKTKKRRDPEIPPRVIAP